MSRRGQTAPASRGGFAVAIAQDGDGRAVFVSLGEPWFRLVSHWPADLDEAEALFERSAGPILSYEQLLAAYRGNVARLADEG